VRPAIRLLIAEVEDAILTPAGELTARALAAAERLREAGVALAITGSRSPRALARIAAPLGITAPIAAFDGGRLVDPDLSVLEQHPLDDAVAASIIACMERHGLDVWVHQDDAWLVRRQDATVAREQAATQIAPVLVEDWAAAVRDAVQIVAVGGDPHAAGRCEAALDEHCAHAAVARSEHGHLVVVHPRANKGEAARAIARRLGVPAAGVATLGACASDVLMFHESGLSIAMGHARAAVQRQATFVTRSNADEGFAYAVETWIVAAGGAAA
jgi:hydroxymethylpyrimidine pyrophosphatase-like HAD family hydrolase